MQRSKKNSYNFAGICFAALAGISSCTSLQEKDSGGGPNFIIILTDDQGYGDLSCFGSPNIRTPNIDRMASEGMRFTSFYAFSFSSPSRAQLLTGCYPARVGCPRNARPFTPYGLHKDEVTIADILKDKDYATMCIGKWHLGDFPEYLPTSQGFDTYFGIPFSNDMWRYHPKMPPREGEDSLMTAIRKRAAYTGFSGQGSYYPPGGGWPNDLPLMKNEEVIEWNPDQRQLTTRFTNAAIDFIKEQKDNPFFLYLAHPMPHVPLFVSEKHEGKSSRGLYGDVIMEIDWSVGKIIDCLKECGLDKNTMLVFTSDNGPWLAYGIDGGSAGQLRAGKGTVYEGGMRVPAIFWWPGKIPAGICSEVIAGTHDLLPTLAGLAGAEVPADRIIDGLDIWPVLSGKSTESPHQFFYYTNGSREGTVNFQGIRDEKWKLLLRMDSEGKVIAKELYDLGADVSERFNRLDQHPEIVNHLSNEAQKFYDDMVKNIRINGHLKNTVDEKN